MKPGLRQYGLQVAPSPAEVMYGNSSIIDLGSPPSPGEQTLLLHVLGVHHMEPSGVFEVNGFDGMAPSAGWNRSISKNTDPDLYYPDECNGVTLFIG